tara:strand:+ start:175 stop:552 length:378 start_codon:yes stop_codon:yes gene_type:complete
MGAYAPFDNASINFDVYSSFTLDANTGNHVPVTVTEAYIANIQLQANKSDSKPGIDENEMACKGRLLSPTQFSDKVKVGSIATCTVNGIEGTLRLTDLGSNTLTFARSTLFQEFIGVFEQNGKAG